MRAQPTKTKTEKEPWAVVLVRLEPEGLDQKLFGTFPTSDAARAFVARLRPLRGYLTDLYVTTNDARLARRLERND